MTCDHPKDAVYWNPYNAVICCHKCGHIEWPATHGYLMRMLRQARKWGVSSEGYDSQIARRLGRDIDIITAPEREAEPTQGGDGVGYSNNNQPSPSGSL